MADATYTPKVYRKQGGDVLVVASGGKIEIESGGEIELQAGALADIVNKVLAAGDIALADGKVLIGNSDGEAAAQTITGDVTVTNGGVTAIGAGVIVNADISAAAAIAASKLANYADLAAMVGAGLANSASYVKTDTGTKTLLAANATKDRGVLVVVHVDETFASGDTSQLILKVGEADTIEKAFASSVFTDAAAGAYFVTGFKNLATKAIVATLTAAAGTGTGGASVTVFALPNS